MADIKDISPALFDLELQDALMTYALKNGARIDELTKEAVKQLVRMTRVSAPRESSRAWNRKKTTRARFHTSIAYKKLEAMWFGASRYLWYVEKPNYRLTHLLAKSHRARNNRIVRGNPFLQNALDTVLRDYEAAIRRYFIE